MRRRFVRGVSLGFMLVFLLSTMPAFADSESAEAKREALEVNGLPHDFVENLDEKWVDYICRYSDGEQVYLGEIVTEYLYQDGISMFREQKPADMTLTIWPIYVRDPAQNGRQPIDRMIIMIVYEWANGRPFITMEDTVSVNWDPALFYFQPDTFEATDYQMLFGSGTWQAVHEHVNPAKLDQGSLGYYAVLKGTADKPPRLKGTACFVLTPTAPVYDEDSPKGTLVRAEYVHDKTPFLGIFLSLLRVGVGLLVLRWLCLALGRKAVKSSTQNER